MKHNLLLGFCLLALSAGCGSGDKVVAEYHHHKLYMSEVRAMMPQGLSADDSAQMVSQVIDSWIENQIVLEEADKSLSLRDKNFDEEVNAYRRSLLRQRYFEKLTSDSKQFEVSDQEVTQEIARTKGKVVSDREIVRLNYVKLSPNSPLLGDLKKILFDESRRQTEKDKVEALCGDSLEYFVEDDKWLFWSDIQKEISLQLPQAEKMNFPLTFEKKVDGSYYLIVMLDYKSEQTGNESEAYFESVRTMLVQKKKTDFINQKLSELKTKRKK